MFNNILIPIDPGDEQMSAKSLATAKDFMKNGVRVTFLAVLQVIPSYIASELPADFQFDTEGKTKSELSEMAQKNGLLNVDIIVKHGLPYPVINEVAEKISADLIIIASHQPGWESYLLGSVASKVVDHAKCSVLVNR